MNSKKIILTAILGISISFSLCAQSLEENLNKIDSYLQKVMKDWESPGMAVAILKDNEIIFAKGYGVRELGKSKLVDENTLFAVGSQTKSFTAAAIAILVDEGKISWDDPVIKYLPQFKLSDSALTRQLTIRDCLSHRSGLDPLLALTLFSDQTKEEILQRYIFAKPISGFRTSFEYNNILFVLAGEIIKAVTGISWEEFVKERIFKPLNMKNSYTSITEYSNQSNYASSHEIIGGKVEVIPLRNIDNFGSAGSINSNIIDMAQWLKMQMNNGMYNSIKLISAQSMNEMHSRQIDVTFPSYLDMPFAFTYPIKLSKPSFLNYGFGWFIQEYRGKTLIHHGGDIDGQRCQTGFIPDLNLGIVIFSNLHPATLVEAALFSIADIFIGGEVRDWSGELLAAIKDYKAKMAESQKQRMAMIPAGAKPPESLEKFAGFYESNAYGKATILYEDGKLIIKLGRITSSLMHLVGNMFLMNTPSVLRSMPISFATNNSGNADRFTLYGVTDFMKVVEK